MRLGHRDDTERWCIRRWTNGKIGAEVLGSGSASEIIRVSTLPLHETETLPLSENKKIKDRDSPWTKENVEQKRKATTKTEWRY